MFDLWETARQRPMASGNDDTVPLRPTAGLLAGWGPFRTAKLRRMQHATHETRPKPSRHPTLAHLGWALHLLRQSGEAEPTEQVLAASADMLDGAIADLAHPADRAMALSLAAMATAVSGHQVHLVCLAEATAARLADRLKPIAGRAGITVASITDEADIDARIDGHKAIIVAASAARFAQDRMRDHALLGGRTNGTRYRIETLAGGKGRDVLIRGEPFAFVDDADLVMIESLRPIGFGADPEEDANRLRAEEAFVVLRGMKSGAHYAVDAPTRRIRLTQRGEAVLELAATLFEGPWLRRHWREETILAALTIRDFFQPGKEYSIDGDRVVMAEPRSSAEVEPGIDALIAAKERLSHSVDVSRVWSYRSFLASYRHLAGAGFATSDLSSAFQMTYGLKVRGKPDPIEATIPDIRTSRRPSSITPEPSDETVVWAPAPDDAAQADRGTGRLAIAEQIFTLPTAPTRIVQLAAAPLRWEQRLRATFPASKIDAVATPADAIWTPLGQDHEALKRMRDTPSLTAYRAGQQALAQAAETKRQTHLRSDRYFERILAFTGETL